MTAQRVAAHRLTVDRVAAPFGDPEADLALARDVAAGVQAPAGRMHDYLKARTAFFDRVVVGALRRRVAQVVVGAAGYDGRAFRYARPGVTWFELDHPSTQRDKVARLARLGVPTEHVRFVEADFATDPVAARLLAAGLDPQAQSLFLLEGVAVYLELPVLEKLLRQLREVAADGSRLAISVSVAASDAAARARFRAAVAAIGQPHRSTLEPQEAGDLLRHTGWVVVPGDEHESGDEAQARRGRVRSAGFLSARAATNARTEERSEPVEP
jgi:methyltransferase (TIGR00027 family)